MKCLLLFVGLSLWMAVSTSRAEDPPAPAQPPSLDNAAAPPPEVDKQRIADLLRQLASADRIKHKDAFNLLWQAGKPALPQLREAVSRGEAAKANSPERKIGRYAKQLIAKIEAPPRQPAQAAGRLFQNGGAQPPAAILPKPESAAGADLMNSFGCKLTESADGLRVTDVRVASHAERIGLKVGDILTSINGRAAASETEANEMLSDPAVLNNLRLEVTRKGEPVSLK